MHLFRRHKYIYVCVWEWIPGVLEFGGGLLFDAENDDVGASDADGGVAFPDSFEGVLHLEQVPVRREHRYRSVVPRHLLLL